MVIQSKTAFKDKSTQRKNCRNKIDYKLPQM